MKESELLNTWLWEKHRRKLQWRNVRLGPLPDKAISRMYLVTLRWTDAIVVDQDAILIIEAKLAPTPTAFGQLDLYAKLFRQTPEFSVFDQHKIQKVFLTTSHDMALVELASEKDIIYKVFTWDEFVASKEKLQSMKLKL